jgi:hypothetical protein
MLETLLESLDKDVYTPEMIESIMTQFNESVETKAKEIADAELTEAVEKAVKEATEVAVNEALEAKEKELEEKAQGYILEALEAKEKELEEKSDSYVEAKLSELNESLDLYLGKVVDEFIAESKDKLNETLKAEKADMIIESFEAMLTMGAIDVMKIAEAKDLSYADAKLSESVSKYDELMTNYLSLEKDNETLAKLGVINEMKEGLSLVESKKFQTLASLVPYSKSEKYAADLEVIKESVKGSVETKSSEVITEAVVKTEQKNVSYSHLV